MCLSHTTLVALLLWVMRRWRYNINIYVSGLVRHMLDPLRCVLPASRTQSPLGSSRGDGGRSPRVGPQCRQCEPCTRLRALPRASPAAVAWLSVPACTPRGCEAQGILEVSQP